jgi:TPR repeat protein/peptidoglycan hydrolase-like protein with peptidoglycan-binding domain
MTGRLNWPRSLAAAPSLAKRPFVLAGVATLLVGAALVSAWLTRPAATAERRAAGEPPSTSSPASVAPIVVPEAPSPPELTSADVARSGDPSAAAPTTAPTIAASTTAVSTSAAEPPKPIDWAAMPIDELRPRAAANEVPAMEELARRLVQGVGVTKDQQAGAGWLLRAAQRGSAQSAFNVAVMYERGFVVERDSARAIEWYRKAIAANLPAAKHNLALLLRDGKGAPRDGKEAVELLRSAARQGMAASMFTLGDIHERGDAAPKDAATALAWFAIAAEFERQTNRGAETALAKTASQRSQTLQRILTPAELERAQQLGQSEFKLIVEALSPPKPAPLIAPASPEVATVDPALPPTDADPPGWPKAANDQVRVIQQALFDLKFLRDKPDGAMGPMTRAAIRTFQRSNAMREIGEPTRDLYAALRDSLASRDVVANSPLPPPPPEKAEIPTVELPKVELSKPEAPKVDAAKAEGAKAEEAKTEAAKAEAAKVEAAKLEAVKAEAAAKVEAAKAEAAKVETEKVEAAKIEAAKAEAAKVAAVKAVPANIDIGRPELPPPPPTSAEIARAMPKDMLAASTKSAPAPIVPEAWPTAPADQVRAIQQLLRDLNFSSDTPDGLNGPNTRGAIRDYERAAALNVTGEPSKVLFDSLMELRLLMVPKAN